MHSKFPLLSQLSVLSALRFSGGSQHLRSVASAVCCSGHSCLLPGAVYLCWPVGVISLIYCLGLAWNIVARCSNCQRCRNYHGDGPLSSLYFPGKISPSIGVVCHQKVIDHSNGTFRWSSLGFALRRTF